MSISKYKILSQKFYQESTLKVAKKLLGKYLIREVGNKQIIGKIIEVEAYVGTRDLASHASKGKTPRTKIMFGPAGHWYTYLIYGMYHCLNVVTENCEYPAAVLIRSIEITSGLDEAIKNRKNKNLKTLTNGPGKLCEALMINKKFNDSKTFKKNTGLYIAQKIEKIKLPKIKSAPRIGVDYAGKYKDKLWRFYI